MNASFSKAILHIDGDSFFASCEQSRNPTLKGKPVITGKERGIAASMSIEAKKLGVTRAMPLYKIRKLIPDVVILPSDYETYSMLSERLYTIVRRYTGDVEEYGIDECFADITGMDKPFHMAYEEIAECLKNDLYRELGFTFSIGLASTKTLAKVASNWKKPFGLTIIRNEEINDFLKGLPIGKVWGIGYRSTPKLIMKGKRTAFDFVSSSEWWIKNNLSSPFYDIWQELQGIPVNALQLLPKDSYHSIQKFKTFTPPSADFDFIFAQLSKNIENACIKARRYNLASQYIYIITRTQEFRHATREIVMSHPTNIPAEIFPEAEKALRKIWKPNILYRATGVVLQNLHPPSVQTDIFHSEKKFEKYTKIYTSVDKVATKYGKHSLFMGTSWRAHNMLQHLSQRGDIPERHGVRLLGENKRKRLNIPMFLGKVV
ncbi:MAG TPA: DNA polymerase IV [Candidatus Magasanikbacteria bacterium]|nr:DNA polymerase IV [Candidatus Magasanikbacteria bacterium]